MIDFNIRSHSTMQNVVTILECHEVNNTYRVL